MTEGKGEIVNCSSRYASDLRTIGAGIVLVVGMLAGAQGDTNAPAVAPVVATNVTATVVRTDRLPGVEGLVPSDVRLKMRESWAALTDLRAKMAERRKALLLENADAGRLNTEVDALRQQLAAKERELDQLLDKDGKLAELRKGVEDQQQAMSELRRRVYAAGAPDKGPTAPAGAAVKP